MAMMLKRSIFNFYFSFFFLMLHCTQLLNLHNYVCKHHECWWKQQYKDHRKSPKGQVKTGPSWTHASYSKNGEKTNIQCRFTLGKQQVCTCITLFRTFYRYHYTATTQNFLNCFMFYLFGVCMNDTRQKFSFCFSELSIHVQSLRFQREKSLPTFSKLHMVMTFEMVQIYFLSRCCSGCLFPRSH